MAKLSHNKNHKYHNLPRVTGYITEYKKINNSLPHNNNNTMDNKNLINHQYYDYKQQQYTTKIKHQNHQYYYNNFDKINNDDNEFFKNRIFDKLTRHMKNRRFRYDLLSVINFMAKRLICFTCPFMKSSIHNDQDC